MDNVQRERRDNVGKAKPGVGTFGFGVVGLGFIYSVPKPC